MNGTSFPVPRMRCFCFFFFFLFFHLLKLMERKRWRKPLSSLLSAFLLLFLPLTFHFWKLFSPLRSQILPFTQRYQCSFSRKGGLCVLLRAGQCTTERTNSPSSLHCKMPYNYLLNKFSGGHEQYHKLN